MPHLKATLNFAFVRNNDKDDSDSEYDYDSSDSDSENERQYKTKPPSKRSQAFARTDAYYEKYDIVEYIKSYDEMGMTEYMIDGDILSAEWLPDTFAMEMVVDTDMSTSQLIEHLQTYSLEDGHYEGCGDSGWVIYTRGPKGEIFYGETEGLYNHWEYGLVDYRQNKITVVPIVMEESDYDTNDS